RLSDSQKNLESLVIVKLDARGVTQRDRIGDRNHGNQHRPLIDVGTHHVHQSHRRLGNTPGPRECRDLFGELREERREPLNEDIAGGPIETKKSAEFPRRAASAWGRRRKGGAEKYNSSPPARNRPAISELRTRRGWARIIRGTLAASSIFSSDCAGIFFMKY